MGNIDVEVLVLPRSITGSRPESISDLGELCHDVQWYDEIRLSMPASPRTYSAVMKHLMVYRVVLDGWSVRKNKDTPHHRPVVKGCVSMTAEVHEKINPTRK
jgi:hypothetical protein